MDTAAIQQRIDKMPAAMSAKGLYMPEAEFVLSANGESRIALRWYKSIQDKEHYRSKCEWFREGTIADQIDAAAKFITALPSKKEAQFREFMTALGGVIDLGKGNGIEVEFLNPLLVTMKKLSENAITFQKPAPHAL